MLEMQHRGCADTIRLCKPTTQNSRKVADNDPSCQQPPAASDAVIALCAVRLGAFVMAMPRKKQYIPKVMPPVQAQTPAFLSEAAARPEAKPLC